MRTLVKALTYRALSLATSTTIGYVLTGSVAKALSFGLIDAVFKLALYAAHESAWERITRLGIVAAATSTLLALGRVATDTDRAEGGSYRFIAA